MKVIGDLPSEVLDEIFSNLDGDSLIVASNVCLSWRRVIHKFTSLHASKCDADVKEKLKKCGWNFGEHDLEHCKCIELNTSSLFKFIGNEALFSQELTPRDRSSNLIHYWLSKNKLFLFTNNDGLGSNILMYDLSQGKLEPNYLLEEYSSYLDYFSDAVVQDQTLVIAYYDFDYNNMRIMVWNHKTVQKVSDLNYLGKIREFTDESNNEVEHDNIAIGRHKLAVHLVIREKFTFRLKNRITQIWTLDTDNPSTENIRYCSIIEHDSSLRSWIGLFMNSKLLCLQAGKNDGSGDLLNVFLIDNLSTSMITSIGSGSQSVIEEGFSTRIAVFHKSDNSLKVYKFFDGNDVFCLDVNLNHIVSMNHGSLFMANFLKGKIMLILNSQNQFQCIIVTEEGEVIEGNRQEVQLGRVERVAVNAYGIALRKERGRRERDTILFFKYC